MDRSRRCLVLAYQVQGGKRGSSCCWSRWSHFSDGIRRVSKGCWQNSGVWDAERMVQYWRRAIWLSKRLTPLVFRVSKGVHFRDQRRLFHSRWWMNHFLNRSEKCQDRGYTLSARKKLEVSSSWLDSTHSRMPNSTVMLNFADQNKTKIYILQGNFPLNNLLSSGQYSSKASNSGAEEWYGWNLLYWFYARHTRRQEEKKG